VWLSPLIFALKTKEAHLPFKVFRFLRFYKHYKQLDFNMSHDIQNACVFGLGEVEIDIDVKAAVRTISLNALDLNVGSAKVIQNGTTLPGNSLLVAAIIGFINQFFSLDWLGAFVLDAKTEILTITLPSDLSVGSAKLFITYVGMTIHHISVLSYADDVSVLQAS
jgi:hypothetical protein